MFRLAVQILLLSFCNGDEKIFWLGGIFDKSDVAGRVAFQLVTEQFSTSKLLFKSQVLSLTNEEDVVDLVDKACGLFLAKPIVVLTSMKWRASENVRALCENHEIPFLLTKMDYSNKLFQSTLAIYPSPTAIGKSISRLVERWNWNTAIVLYQDETGLVQIQELMSLINANERPVFFVQRLNLERQFKPQLKVLKEFRKVKHFVIQADTASTIQFLKDAEQMDMLTANYHYVFTDMDTYTLDMSRYQNHGCNITVIRLVDDESDHTKRLMASLRNYKVPQGALQVFRGHAISTYLSVLYDAVKVIIKTAIELQNVLEPIKVDCRAGVSWQEGTTFLNFIKTTAYKGSTGHIQFDNFGRRVNTTLRILQMTPSGFTKYAEWNEMYGLKILMDQEKPPSLSQSLKNKVLRVTAYMEEPFVMHKKSVEKLSGNDRYEGFCVDLLEHIAQLNKFNYTIQEVKDKSYGTPDAQGSWSGLIGELVRGEADLAVASVTINFVRSEVIDFSVPFMHLGIAVLYKKPERTPPGLLSFLAPLSLDVWIYMGAACMVVTVILWLVAHISPSEWVLPQQHSSCDTGDAENQFSLGNSCWFTIGSLMQQGCDIAPKAMGTRMVASVWWFFTLILISSYTANLAAFLTVERMEYTITSAEDLARQTKIKYGHLNRGSTMQFFKDSKIPVYEKMWNTMKSANPSVFVNSSPEGIARVKQGGYAYLMESSMLEYYVERDCELTQVGGLLDSKGYGIGLKKGSPYREDISRAILKLQETTVLAELKEKWWKRRAGAKCVSDNIAGTAAELGLQNVGGVFVVMIIGMVVALAITIAEKVRHYTIKRRMDNKTKRLNFAQCKRKNRGDSLKSNTSGA